ncbi:hypothetical protein [Arthrobacter sp. CDRTa11]|uniref:Vgb family protein n=1 Tax=Arthrobacter sp. CDRTa11 TaxID=2651199 RepID=UPI002265C14B|nr:hypothetical protein [Arthrobacter sp. CDRTa11]
MNIKPFSRAVCALLLAGAAALLAPAPASAQDSQVINVSGQPLGVVAGPDGTLYVSDYNFLGGVSVFRSGEAQAFRHIKVGHFSTSMAMTSDGTLYVLQSTESMQTELGVVTPGAGEVSATIPLTQGNHWLTTSPDGSLYVASGNDGTVSVVLPGGTKVHRVMEAGHSPVEVTVAKGGTAYAVNQHAGTVSVIPSGATSPSHTIDVGKSSSPHGIAAAPDGNVYVANVLSNAVAVIEPGGTKVARWIRVGREPQEVVAGPDGRVYVTNSADNTVSVIPPGADRVAETIPTGEDPGRLALTADGSVVVVNRGDKTLTVFDAGLLGSAPAALSGGAVDAADDALKVAAGWDVFSAGVPVIAAGSGALLLAGAAVLIAVLRRRRPLLSLRENIHG